VERLVGWRTQGIERWAAIERPDGRVLDFLLDPAAPGGAEVVHAGCPSNLKGRSSSQGTWID
jgi:hypothetical protein